MKLESLKNDLFSPMSNTESAMIKGGMAEATSKTVWSNSYVDGVYIGTDKDTFTDQSPTPAQGEMTA